MLRKHQREFSLTIDSIIAGSAIRTIYCHVTPGGGKSLIPIQAGRAAWKLQSDWVDIQMSFIELKQVEIMQVFLAYVYSPVTKQTFFEKIKPSGYKLLVE